jgi:hypothetical protein
MNSVSAISISRPLVSRLHLILADEAPHRGDLGDALQAHQVVAEVPVLDRPQLGEIQAPEVGGALELAPRDAPIPVAVEGLDDVAEGPLPTRLGTLRGRTPLDGEEIGELVL